MNLWFGKCAVLVALLGYCIIRAPHGKRSRALRIVDDRKDPLDMALLAIAFLGTTILPVVWALTEFPARANFPLRPLPYGMGLVFMVGGLWLFYRTHADLAGNWSITLQLREEHRLITHGIYRRIRHPMYTSMFLLSIAHLLFVPNWIVAPTYFMSFAILYLFRVKREERMMLDRFGAEYEAYMRRTGRLLPW